ncbi:hypothetical protein [Halarcobacter sp.]|uniref:hypothetical protein n=1 Tax=Halarcobacter sp. TaxID=2321133 RepID=UPI002AAAB9B4|nr:hypothetical protein [Halarcobacter sp.]
MNLISYIIISILLLILGNYLAHKYNIFAGFKGWLVGFYFIFIGSEFLGTSEKKSLLYILFNLNKYNEDFIYYFSAFTLLILFLIAFYYIFKSKEKSYF